MLIAWRQSQIVYTTYLTLSPKILYVGLAPCATRRGGFLALCCEYSQPSPKPLSILGAMIPVSVESRTALR